MIKIEINNLQQKKQEYLVATLSRVATRVSILEKSLSHLHGDDINFTENNLTSLKAITREIASLVGDKLNIPNGQNGYSSAIEAYLVSANHLGNINLNGLLDFCRDLLANTNKLLSELLICDASELMNLNQTLLQKHALNTINNIAVIKLAFDYTYETIASEVKNFFRINQFVSACPYCNKVEARHYTNGAGEVVESFQLDHFYDKATYPLLAYCFFNLVPSDQTCNTLNKHDTEFNDEYHINPHHKGYLDRFKFEPTGWNTAYKVNQIKVKITVPQNSASYKQIKGDNPPHDENGELGNLNVFKILSKYQAETHKAGKMLEELNNRNKYLKHLKKFLKNLNEMDRKNSYLKWYERNFNVRFKNSDFNEKKYSKFCRDLHDYYFSENSNLLNKYIQDLIKKY